MGKPELIERTSPISNTKAEVIQRNYVLRSPGKFDVSASLERKIRDDERKLVLAQLNDQKGGDRTLIRLEVERKMEDEFEKRMEAERERLRAELEINMQKELNIYKIHI